MRLAYDVSRCANDQCEQRNTCLRWLVPGRPDGNQTFSMFPGGSDCSALIGVREATA
jgi:hypothetical protein